MEIIKADWILYDFTEVRTEINVVFCCANILYTIMSADDNLACQLSITD